MSKDEVIDLTSFNKELLEEINNFKIGVNHEVLPIHPKYGEYIEVNNLPIFCNANNKEFKKIKDIYYSIIYNRGEKVN
ncbi:MAG: hypothetical protein M0R03_20965 [Novosphingobium sp.]|nr:hypothetical protein [Novosphingobium sp.]